jgi:DNA-directed RNA polymerase specialized sigma24 family protein
MSTADESISERLLVEQCLAGKNAAWQQLCDQYQGRLRDSIQRSMGPEACNQSLVDEIETSVWESLQQGNGRRLRAFDASRGRLAAYLAAIGFGEILKHRRRNHQRRAREVSLRWEPVDGQSGDWLLEVMLEEFMAQLSPQELSFCRHFLLCRTEEPLMGLISASNARQLTQRIRRKLEAYLYGH